MGLFAESVTQDSAAERAPPRLLPQVVIPVPLGQLKTLLLTLKSTGEVAVVCEPKQTMELPLSQKLDFSTSKKKGERRKKGKKNTKYCVVDLMII